MSTPKQIALRASDGKTFQVDETVAMEMQTVKGYFDDDGDGVSRDAVMPLPNVESIHLARVIEYCTKRIKLGSKPEGQERDAVKDWEAKLVKGLDDKGVKELLLAADYLNVKDLLELLLQALADRIANKSVEYVRALFDVVNDFKPEEEKGMRDEYAWAFEGVGE